MLETALPMDLSISQPEADAPARTSRPRLWLVLQAVGLACFVMFAAECLRIFVGSNYHCVMPDKCYRAAQPTPAFLESMQQAHGIRSILNLRDENDDQAW